MDSVLSIADRVLEEKRDRVKHLREQDDVDLRQALENAGEDLNWHTDIGFLLRAEKPKNYKSASQGRSLWHYALGFGKRVHACKCTHG